MKRQFFVYALLLIVLGACSGYGTKLNFAAGEVYYTENANEAEAKGLGNYLLNSGYFDSTTARTVQLDQKEGTHLVRMVVQEEAWKDSTNHILFQLIGSIMKDSVFNWILDNPKYMVGGGDTNDIDWHFNRKGHDTFFNMVKDKV